MGQALQWRELQARAPRTADGPVSSTVIDFRIGRLLGVAYVATMGNCERHDLVERQGRELERKIISAVLEVP